MTVFVLFVEDLARLRPKPISDRLEDFSVGFCDDDEVGEGNAVPVREEDAPPSELSVL